MTKMAFIDGQVVDPQTGKIEKMNLLLNNGILVGKGYMPDEKEDEIEVIDCKGSHIIADIIDTTVDLCDPGFTHRESIASGVTAALAGGITGLVTTPHTYPIIDTPEMIRYVQNHAQAPFPIFPLGALTKSKRGEELAEMGLMRGEGAAGFMDDGAIADPTLMQNALVYSQMFHTVLAVNPLGNANTRFGMMHEGYQSTVLGLEGISRSQEEVVIARDIALVEKYGGTILFSPISTAGSVQLIRQAKQAGLSVYCATAPQYLCLTDEILGTYDTNLKVFPPLRERDDAQALLDGIQDGTIDMLTSHHQPRSIDDKYCDFVTAESGMSGLEFLLPLAITHLVEKNHLPITTVAKLLSRGPKHIFQLPRKGLSLGVKPSFTVINTKTQVTKTPDNLLSKGHNSPFLNQSLNGKVRFTVVDGDVLYRA